MGLSPRPAALGVVVLAALFAALQFVRPPLANPPVTADLDAPAPVKAILRNSCYACHSNETRLPWFDQVVPAYWLVARDVRAGRERLNFSTIGALPEAKRKALLWESVNMTMLGAMPLSDYVLVHRDAKVTPEQLEVLKEWLHPAMPALVPAPAPAPVPPASPVSAEVRPAPNGMAFPAGYKDWTPVSTTDRFDNHTLRMILGNPAAQQAIAEGRVKPWPDGAAFAKIAYAPGPDGKAAAFKQVEFMVKDAKGHAATEGWAFARWVVADGELKPYGKDKEFARECAGCHAPMKENDFVYTLPLAEASADSSRFNPLAALPAGLGLPPILSWKALASSVDAAASTMTTVYADGSMLARVTWERRDDPHWFGARIPGAVRSVEVVGVSADAAGGYSYSRYSGAPLAKEPEGADRAARIQEIVAEKPSPLLP